MDDRTHAARWAVHARRGEFAEAWRISDTVLARGIKNDPRLPHHFRSVWNGTPLEDRRVLVRCYHGLGDTIQFARYLPEVQAIAKRVTVLAQPELVPVLHDSIPVDILPATPTTSEPQHDVAVEIMELAHVFRTTLATIPSSCPYLHAEPATIHRDSKLQVGIVWRGGDWDERRSIAFTLIETLGSITGITWHVLQHGDGLAERTEGWGVLSSSDSLLQTARIIRALDLLITIDSMPAHLAGALGVPVWTLLHADADWRWLEQREDSPWYPTMRLFRQPEAGDWESVIARIRNELLSRDRDR